MDRQARRDLPDLLALPGRRVRLVPPACRALKVCRERSGLPDLRVPRACRARLARKVCKGLPESAVTRLSRLTTSSPRLGSVPVRRRGISPYARRVNARLVAATSSLAALAPS